MGVSRIIEVYTTFKDRVFRNSEIATKWWHTICTRMALSDFMDEDLLWDMIFQQRLAVYDG